MIQTVAPAVVRLVRAVWDSVRVLMRGARLLVAVRPVIGRPASGSANAFRHVGRVDTRANS